MRGIENAGHDGKSVWVLSSLPRRFLVASFLITSSCAHSLTHTLARSFVRSLVRSLFSPVSAENDKENGELRVRVIYKHVYTGVLPMSFPDRLPISRGSIVVRDWSRKRAFIVSTTNEIRFCVELPAPIAPLPRPPLSLSL